MTDNTAREEFEQGRIAGRSKGDVGPKPNGEAITTQHSIWFGLVCPSTGHTFRRGDVVRFGADLSETPTLMESAVPPASPALTDFYRGMEQFAQDARYLVPGDPLLAPPLTGVGRRRCLICGHTFRSGDRVITCPCSSESGKRLCEATVHQDPSRSLVCFDSWKESLLVSHCLANSRRRTP